MPVGPLHPAVREFGFELALCAALADGERLVSRQLGAAVEARRVMDVILVEPGPGFDARRAITPETIPRLAIDADVGAGRARYWKDAFDGLCHPDHARSVVERAVEVGFFETERRGGRQYVRQTARYPDWVGRLVGIENKPDLDRPGDLETQLLIDAKLGLFDEVWLATESYVTGAHLNRFPDPVGVWRFDPETGEREVVREAEPLATDEPGVELRERTPARTDVNVASAAEKARARRTLAERAYGKGWRTYDLPGCANCEAVSRSGSGGLPYCAHYDRLVRPAEECGADCPGYDPADPPEANPEAERAAESPWDPDPEGHTRRQSGLGRFS